MLPPRRRYCFPTTFVLWVVFIYGCAVGSHPPYNQAPSSRAVLNQSSLNQNSLGKTSVSNTLHQPPKTRLRSIEQIDVPNSTRINGVALVIHGLNVRPDKMGALISELTASGVAVVNLSLRGHGKNHAFDNQYLSPKESRMYAFKTVSHSIWLQESRHAYYRAKRISRNQNVPIFLVAYSYGALLGGNLFAYYHDVHFDKMVLLAPAFSITIVYGLKWLTPFPKLVIPSLSSTAYRANSGTPMAAYNALFSTITHFKTHLGPKLNVPTLIFIDPKDELVSYRGLKHMIKVNNLTRWTIQPLKKEPTGLKMPAHHLIIDEPSVGSKTWEGLRTQLIKHLLPDH